MIVKMKFLQISGPQTDLDRMCRTYLTKHEMQLESALSELKTTDNSKINNSILKWENLGKIEKENTNRKIIKINKFLKNKIKKYKEDKKNSIKLNNQKILKKSCNKSSVVDETKKNNNSINDVRENNTNKEKKVKGTLKRNVSQADLFNIE